MYYNREQYLQDALEDRLAEQASACVEGWQMLSEMMASSGWDIFSPVEERVH